VKICPINAIVKKYVIWKIMKFLMEAEGMVLDVVGKSERAIWVLFVLIEQ
jgi:hypothetical protein